MKIRKTGNNKFKVESSAKGRFYAVDLNAPSCTCAHFMFRLRNTGAKCKHIAAVEEKHSRKKKTCQKSILAYSKILEEAKKKGSIETVVLMEKYGEAEVQELINNGDLIENKGEVRVTE